MRQYVSSSSKTKTATSRSDAGCTRSSRGRSGSPSGTAMREVLEEIGIDVCGSEYGRQLGQGLLEPRLRGNLGEWLEDAAASDAAEERSSSACSVTHTGTR
jgi:hypothetical protein